jgi:hypothetical protein
MVESTISSTHERGRINEHECFKSSSGQNITITPATPYTTIFSFPLQKAMYGKYLERQGLQAVLKAAQTASLDGGQIRVPLLVLLLLRLQLPIVSCKIYIKA